jgi:hypothetical protein
MACYAIDLIIVKLREKYWEEATDLEIAMKLMQLRVKYMPVDKGNPLMKDIAELHEYNQEFRIECYREGIKNRLGKLLISK